MGLIYIIRSTKTSKVYIGQTTKTLEYRWKKHKQSARMILEANDGTAQFNLESSNYLAIRKSPLYNAMADLGIDTFSIELLEDDIPTDQLNDLEVLFIEEFNCRIPTGFNATSGGGSKYQHADESKALMKQRKLENLDQNRHEYARGLPPCVTYNERLESLIIRLHPLCKHATFSTSTYGSIENARKALIEFVNELEHTGSVHKKEKQGGDDLKDYPGLKKTKKGYKLEKYINGTCYHAGFESMKITDDEKLYDAIEYYDKNIRHLL